MKSLYLFLCDLPCRGTILLLALILPFSTIAQTFPEGFTAVQIATGMLKPTAMTFTPDGRILVAQQDGAVRVIKNGTLLTTPMVKLRVNVRGEGGLVGITVDPNFATNQYLYVYYTLPDGSRNRISRFTCNGDVAALASEKVVLNLDTLIATIHNGGAMRFKDGKLYVAIGDNSNEANAQNLDTYHGKVIRINPDGTVPAGNPFTSGSEQRRRIWSYGLRNPFTFDLQAGTGKIYANDVGLNKWEEINDVTLPGRNYGWPEAEGSSTNPAFTNPVYSYAHGTNDALGCAITGGAFFNPAQTNYPAAYTGRYFFQDYCSQWIKTLVFAGSSVTVEPFAASIGNDALYLTLGNDGNLYYIVRSTGSVYRITYSTNEAPVILKHPVSLSVSLGQQATFSVTASGKAPLSYQWQKNGVNISGATTATFTIAEVTAADAGSYRVRVTNSIGNVTSNTAQLTVTGSNHLPVAQIITPASGALYRAGDVISFSGDASDDEDGVLPAASFVWFVDFHHDTHHHDGPPVASGVKSGSFTIPVRGETSDNVWYKLSLVVTDSHGGKDTVSRDVYPRKSTITLHTQPAGMKIRLDGQSLNSPLSIVSVEKLERTIGAVTPQAFNGKTYVFERWIHGGTETQIISTPLDDVTYTAVYKETTGVNTIQREVWTGITGTSVSSIPLHLPPTSISDLTSFEGPTNAGTDYGSRIRAYIHAPITGNYIFWIASDDKSELWLSTNDSPANRRIIASVSGYTSVRQWNKYPVQQSVPISLVAGQKYYIEALHKEAAGVDHVAVGWQLPDASQERPIPGSRLSRYVTGNSLPVVTISNPVQGKAYTAPANVVISADASDPDGSVVKVEFYQGANKLGEDVSAPYSFTWANVPSANYELRARAIDNAGASATASVNIVVKGMIQRELWSGITGTAVTAIPVNTSPASVSNLYVLEGPSNVGSDYGARIRGYVHAPSTGSYTFWIASDDRSELWLSTSEGESGKLKIAAVNGHTEARQWTKYPAQQSLPVNLVAGRKYYIEVLHKEATGRDHVAVGWQLPGGNQERPIPGNRLSPFASFETSTTTLATSTNEEEDGPGDESRTDDEGEENMFLFPNPAYDGNTSLTIAGNGDFKNAVEAFVQVKTVTGDIVFENHIFCGLDCEMIPVNIDRSLPSGVYVVSTTINKKQFTRRWIVH